MPAVLEFSVIFPAPPLIFRLLIATLAVLVLYWVAKWLISIYTGS